MRKGYIWLVVIMAVAMAYFSDAGIPYIFMAGLVALVVLREIEKKRIRVK